MPRRTTTLLVGALVLVAVSLRVWQLGAPRFWVDEAESALNALTIVAEGVPRDRVMGEPLYENTLVREWHGHPEYEFRDLSYSDRGLAVYHSWLPLYSMALAFRLAGVTPASAHAGSPVRDASPAELAFWTAIPRLPAVAFGALLVVAAWGLGRHVHSVPVALALAWGVATSEFFVGAGRQARYYAAALAFSTVAGLAVWRAWRRGRLIDHALVGVAIGVLFHAHSLSAVALTGLYIVSAPLGWRQPRLWLRVGMAGAIAGLLIVPWAIWTGMLAQVGRQPTAREFVDGALIVNSLPRNPIVWLTLGGGVLWFAVAAVGAGRLSERVRQPILEERPAVAFLLAWQAVSYLVYFTMMPAVSLFPYRLKLMVAVPGLLLMAVVMAALGRVFTQRTAFAPAALAALLALGGQTAGWGGRAGAPDEHFAALLSDVRSWTFPPGARVYASPNDHLVLTYYSGRLVQSIAPIRREWLDRFDGDLVIIEAPSYSPPRPSEIRRVALQHGVSLSPAEARDKGWEATRAVKALELQAVGAVVSPLPTLSNALDQTLVELVRSRTRTSVGAFVRGTPLAQRDLANYDEFRREFFYWFSNPERRKGDALNYGACRANARASVHISGYAVLDCRKTTHSALLSSPTQLTRQ